MSDNPFALLDAHLGKQVHIVGPETGDVLHSVWLGEELRMRLKCVSGPYSSERLFEMAKGNPSLRKHLRTLITTASDAVAWVSRYSEDREFLRHLVTDSEHAYYWATIQSMCGPGPEVDRMRPLVTESEWAFKWAVYWSRLSPKEVDQMRPRVTEPYWALQWAWKWPNDRDTMRPFVTESGSALYWAENWPEDRHLMRPFVTGSLPAMYWVRKFPEDADIMRPHLNPPELWQLDGYFTDRPTYDRGRRPQRTLTPR